VSPPAPIPKDLPLSFVPTRCVTLRLASVAASNMRVFQFKSSFHSGRNLKLH